MFKWVLDEFLAHFVQPVVDGWPVVAVSFGFWLGLQLTLDYIFPSICPSWYQAIRNSSQKESWANIRTRIMGKATLRKSLPLSAPWLPSLPRHFPSTHNLQDHYMEFMLQV